MGKFIAIILFAKCALFVVIIAQRNLNDQCKVARSGSNGICKYYEDCPVVLKELLDQGLMPAKCGFKDRREIICCPLPPTPKPTIAIQTTNRISAKSKSIAPLN